MRGFQVLTVPENATHFLTNSDGFQADWAGKFAQVSMQRIFLEYQIAQEEGFKAFGKLHPSKPAVLLLDCCTLNSKVYVSDEQWQQVLKYPGKPPFTEEELCSRYDLIIHMATCAGSGHYEWGPGSNNPGRYHTPKEAEETDQRCQRVFSAHPQLRVVPHFPAFDDKIRKVLDFVNDALRIEGLAGKRVRRPLPSFTGEKMIAASKAYSLSAFIVTSTFLDDHMEHSVRRRARVPFELFLSRYQATENRTVSASAIAAAGAGLHCADSDNDCSAAPEFLKQATDIMYERRHHVRSASAEVQGYMTRRVMNEEDYYEALSASTASGSTTAATTKYMVSVVEGAHYYELFFFRPGCETRYLDYDEEANVPEIFKDDVSSANLGLKGDDTNKIQSMIGTTRKDRPRFLGRHSTEEAAACYGAMDGSQKRQRQS